MIRKSSEGSGNEVRGLSGVVALDRQIIDHHQQEWENMSDSDGVLLLWTICWRGGRMVTHSLLVMGVASDFSMFLPFDWGWIGGGNRVKRGVVGRQVRKVRRRGRGGLVSRVKIGQR